MKCIPCDFIENPFKKSPRQNELHFFHYEKKKKVWRFRFLKIFHRKAQIWLICLHLWYIFEISKDHPSKPCQTEEFLLNLSLIGFSDKIQVFVKKKHSFKEDENEILLHRKVVYPPIEQFVWSEFSIKAFKKSVVFIWHYFFAENDQNSLNISMLSLYKFF